MFRMKHVGKGALLIHHVTKFEIHAAQYMTAFQSTNIMVAGFLSRQPDTEIVKETWKKKVKLSL
jgi:hypothetical protein